MGEEVSARPELGEWAGLVGESGELGGRLAAALGGADGPEAQATALDALQRLFHWWRNTVRLHEDRWERLDNFKGKQPAWVEAEALPGLQGLAVDESAGTEARASALDLLRFCLLEDVETEDWENWTEDWEPWVMVLWKGHAGVLLDCLRPEHGSLSLHLAIVRFLSALRDFGWKRLDLETFPPAPVVRSLAVLSRFLGVRSQAGHLELRHEMAVLLDDFPLGEVLKEEGLARLLLEHRRRESWKQTGPRSWTSCYRRPWPEKLAEELSMGDPRVWRFLTEGGWRLYVPAVHCPGDPSFPYKGPNCDGDCLEVIPNFRFQDPYDMWRPDFYDVDPELGARDEFGTFHPSSYGCYDCEPPRKAEHEYSWWQLANKLRWLSQLLDPAVVEPAAAGLRAQLLGDAGCDELLRLLSLHPPSDYDVRNCTHLPDDLALFRQRFYAARHSTRSRLPNEIRFCPSS